jgi:hypothetical protein
MSTDPNVVHLNLRFRAPNANSKKSCEVLVYQDVDEKDIAPEFMSTFLDFLHSKTTALNTESWGLSGELSAEGLRSAYRKCHVLLLIFEFTV